MNLLTETDEILQNYPDKIDILEENNKNIEDVTANNERQGTKPKKDEIARMKEQLY